jgi:hypothetical protein
MRNVKSVFKGLGMFMYFLLSKEVVAQKIEFASTSFVSYITNGTSTWGLTFCADSATNIYIFDENGSLLSTSYIPSSGCSELIYDSAILSNATSFNQIDKTRLIINTDVKGVFYHTSSQHLISSVPNITPYPSFYEMRLLPPPTMAGTANIQLGYNFTVGTNTWPYTWQQFGYITENIGISDTSNLVIYPGWPHPLLNSQNYYSVKMWPDAAWMEGSSNGSTSPIFPLYYPPTIIEQDSSTVIKGRFITNTGISFLAFFVPFNPWAYNTRFMFFPLAYEFLGTNYHTIPHATRLGDSLMAFSFHDGTILNVNGTIDTLDKGEIYRTLIDTPATWTANHPFSLVQISRQSAQDSVFQSAIFAYSVHPDEALLTYTWYPSEIIDDTIPNQQSYLNLLSPSNGVNTVKLDGNSLASFFQPYSNDSSWSWAQIPVASSLHQLEADSGVVAYAYQYGESCGAGFNVGGLRMKNSVTTSQPEIETTTGFKLYPNPASDFVNLTQIKTAQEDLHLSVWSMDGRMLMEETLIRPPYRLNIAALPAGMYLLKVNTRINQRNQTLRFIKNP